MRGEFLKDFEKTSRGKRPPMTGQVVILWKWSFLSKGKEGSLNKEVSAGRGQFLPSEGLRPDLSLFNGLFLRSKDGNNIRNMA